MAATLKNLAAQVEVREPVSSGRLTLYPLFEIDASTEPRSINYLLLEEALDSGLLEIGEVCESGDVNTVVINNMTGKPVLIIDGEEILGAKQNRMVNATILVAAAQKVEIPVSCVERGRWNYTSEKFSKSDTIAYSSLRRQKAAQVSMNLAAEQGFASDQGAIWAEIDRTQEHMRTNAPTGALHETYRQKDEELNHMVEDLQLYPGQVGIAAYISNRFICLDLFDKAATLEKLWPRLLRSYALDALASTDSRLDAPLPEAAEVIGKIDNSTYLTYPSVGLGLDLRFSSPDIIGAGLVADDQLVHLSVFSAAESDRQGGISSPRRRKRNLSL